MSLRHPDGAACEDRHPDEEGEQLRALHQSGQRGEGARGRGRADEEQEEDDGREAQEPRCECVSEVGAPVGFAPETSGGEEQGHRHPGEDEDPPYQMKPAGDRGRGPIGIHREQGGQHQAEPNQREYRGSGEEGGSSTNGGPQDRGEREDRAREQDEVRRLNPCSRAKGESADRLCDGIVAPT